MKRDGRADGPMSHAKRLQARLWFQSLPGADVILALEAEPQDGNAEPLDV
jgi:hypothetical protein